MSKALKPIEVLSKVSGAVEALGVKGDVIMHDLVPGSGDTDRIKVFVSGKYFGVYDTVRETFVD